MAGWLPHPDINVAAMTIRSVSCGQFVFNLFFSLLGTNVQKMMPKLSQAPESGGSKSVTVVGIDSFQTIGLCFMLPLGLATAVG